MSFLQNHGTHKLYHVNNGQLWHVGNFMLMVADFDRTRWGAAARR
jgi:hypothetical protein